MFGRVLCGLGFHLWSVSEEARKRATGRTWRERVIVHAARDICARCLKRRVPVARFDGEGG